MESKLNIGDVVEVLDNTTCEDLFSVGQKGVLVSFNYDMWGEGVWVDFGQDVWCVGEIHEEGECFTVAEDSAFLKQWVVDKVKAGSL